MNVTSAVMTACEHQGAELTPTASEEVGNLLGLSETLRQQGVPVSDSPTTFPGPIRHYFVYPHTRTDTYSHVCANTIANAQSHANTQLPLKVAFKTMA